MPSGTTVPGREWRGFEGTQASRGLALALYEQTRQTPAGAELGLLKVHTEVSPHKPFKSQCYSNKLCPQASERRKGAHLVGLR